MTQAQKVLKVAISQIGYCESPRNSNRTKYGKAFGMNGVPWCAEFVWWCFMKAGLSNLVPKDASADGLQDGIVKYRGGKWVMKKAYNNTTKKNHLKKFRPGDVVTFDFGRNNGYRQHIGIIEKVVGNYVICIEGNTSKSGSQSNGGMVVRQRRIYSSICAVARPRYSDSTPDKLEPLEVDGIMGYETICRLQRWLKVDEDGIIGEQTVKALQKAIGLKGKDVDGEWGKITTTQLQRFLNTQIGAGLVTNGRRDKATIKALQRFLNKVVKK